MLCDLGLLELEGDVGILFLESVVLALEELDELGELLGLRYQHLESIDVRYRLLRLILA